jgi:hypothetical protein
MAIIAQYTPVMDDLGYIVVAAVVCCLLLPFVHAWAWCLADLRRDTTLEPPARSRWLVLLLLVSVLAIPMYVNSGPGRGRWDPRTLWWPWKR